MNEANQLIIFVFCHIFCVFFFSLSNIRMRCFSLSCSEMKMSQGHITSLKQRVIPEKHLAADVFVSERVEGFFKHRHTLYALRSDDVSGLMRWILHPGTSNAQLLHDAVQEPLDVGLRHLVRRAGAAGWSPAKLQAQEEAEQR